MSFTSTGGSVGEWLAGARCDGFVVGCCEMGCFDGCRVVGSLDGVGPAVLSILEGLELG